MSPEMMRMAQEQMAKMSPEQLQAMQQQMANMDPATMAKMQQQMGMNGVDVQAAQDKMKNMSTSELEQIQSQARNMNGAQMDQQAKLMNDQAAYRRGGAAGAKEEGNRLFKSGQYTQAVERYQSSLSSAALDMSAEGMAIKTACKLNLASCHLKTDEYKQCIDMCSQVIQTDSQNVKARYRRSQAHRKLDNIIGAYRDATVAHLKEPGNDAVTEFWEGIKEGVGSQADGMTDQQLEEAATPTAASAPTFDRDVLLGKSVKELRQLLKEGGSDTSGCTSKDDMIDKLLTLPALPAVSVSSAVSAVPSAAGLDPAQVERARQQMKDNPDAIKQAAKRMENLTDAELAAMNAQLPAGQQMTMDKAKMVSGMMANMSPEQMGDYTKMAEQMQAGAGAQPQGMDQARAMEAMQKNPEMMKQAAETMKNMSEDDLNRMAEASGMGGKLTPEMAKMAGSMMGNMSPDDLARMQKMSADMGGAGGKPDMAQVSKMMEDPAMMESMASMMSNMSPEMAEQMGMTPEQAAQASESMKGMDPKTMQKVMKWGLRAQGAWHTVKSKNFWLQALLFLLGALVLGHFTNAF